MQLITEKSNLAVPPQAVPRPRLLRILDRDFADTAAVWLGAGGGMGKTVAVCQWLEQNAAAAGLFRLDAPDNDPVRFCAYLTRAARQAGVDCPQPGAAPPDLQAVTDNLLAALQAAPGRHVLVLDRLETLTSPALWAALAQLVDDLPPNCRLVLLSCGALPEVLIPAAFRGRLSVLPAQLLRMDGAEVRELFRRRGVALTPAQAQTVCTRTGGWPGAVAAVARYLQDNLPARDEIALWDRPLLQRFFGVGFWAHCSGAERQLYRSTAGLAWFTAEFCTRILGLKTNDDLLQALHNRGFLEYEPRRGRYAVPAELKLYLELSAQAQDPFADGALAGRAAAWYAARGDLPQALGCACRGSDPEVLRGYLRANVQQVLHLISAAQLRACLDRLPARDDDPAILYLRGVAALWENRRPAYEAAAAALRAACEAARPAPEPAAAGSRDGTVPGMLPSGPSPAEFLVNLLYEDPQCSILAWLDTAEQYAARFGPFRLYSVTAETPSVCNGTKELTPLFCCGTREQRAYARRWQAVVHPPQQRLLELAGMEYLLETGRAAQAEQELRAFLAEREPPPHSAEQMGVAGVLIKLSAAGHDLRKFDEMLENCAAVVQADGFWMAADNLQAARLLARLARGDREGLARWMLYREPRRGQAVTRENALQLLVRACGFISLRQYEQAHLLLPGLAEYYARRGLTLLQAECHFADAAALYRTGRRAQALRAATLALTLGGKYRYLDLYTRYGQAGAALIREYRQMMGLAEPARAAGKKRYYYGNVLRASYEEYQRMLLRAAERGLRSQPDDAPSPEPLTLTETEILQYIGEGCTNRQIGERMNIKLTTVKTHVSSICRKLGAENRLQAASRGRELHLI